MESMGAVQTIRTTSSGELWDGWICRWSKFVETLGSYRGGVKREFEGFCSSIPVLLYMQ
uniref:Uncharacterized protein n=1 Tax=Triticum urartu TaxID=4572 RepID=A0A8R7P5X2_TRIUA